MPTRDGSVKTATCRVPCLSNSSGSKPLPSGVTRLPVNSTTSEATKASMKARIGTAPSIAAFSRVSIGVCGARSVMAVRQAAGGGYCRVELARLLEKRANQGWRPPER
ncbi:hypothetical protein G6F35_018680 [Rhizopus arrhizus]|nr:hypothetical protein G6F40_013159 [Rhizopus arrhizus]KAG1165619.1 hypothetical protein G6F35_018680 [Rhizopus arrhizus]